LAQLSTALRRGNLRRLVLDAAPDPDIFAALAAEAKGAVAPAKGGKP
jgi:hypothetical protein